MSYQYLLFDSDRTLLDFNSSQRAAVKKTFEKYGISVNEEVQDFYNSWNNSLWDRLEKGEITHDELLHMRFPVVCTRYNVNYPGYGKMETDYILNLSEGHDLMPGALKTVKALYGKYRLYIITNGLPMVQAKRLKDSGLEAFMDGVFISDEIGYSKPKIRYFEEVYQRIGCPDKNKILIIGDSMSADIKGGVDFGVDTVLVSKADNPTEGYDYSPTAVVKNISEIPDFLAALAKEK
ncbi:MAG: YjjG family noncanonical pyrimidine nucleotidase [Lachnospiraceae bacterium]|nr:YjjG family noncanonical pyrimidine nucleotidase [Lachnospiraceae bacterium]